MEAIQIVSIENKKTLQNETIITENILESKIKDAKVHPLINKENKVEIILDDLDWSIDNLEINSSKRLNVSKNQAKKNEKLQHNFTENNFDSVPTTDKNMKSIQKESKISVKATNNYGKQNKDKIIEFIPNDKYQGRNQDKSESIQQSVSNKIWDSKNSKIFNDSNKLINILYRTVHHRKKDYVTKEVIINFGAGSKVNKKTGSKILKETKRLHKTVKRIKSNTNINNTDATNIHSNCNDLLVDSINVSSSTYSHNSLSNCHNAFNNDKNLYLLKESGVSHSSCKGKPEIQEIQITSINERTNSDFKISNAILPINQIVNQQESEIECEQFSILEEPLKESDIRRSNSNSEPEIQNVHPSKENQDTNPHFKVSDTISANNEIVHQLDSNIEKSASFGSDEPDIVRSDKIITDSIYSIENINIQAANSTFSDIDSLMEISLITSIRPKDMDSMRMQADLTISDEENIQISILKTHSSSYNEEKSLINECNSRKIEKKPQKIKPTENMGFYENNWILKRYIDNIDEFPIYSSTYMPASESNKLSCNSEIKRHSNKRSHISDQSSVTSSKPPQKKSKVDSKPPQKKPKVDAEPSSKIQNPIQPSFRHVPNVYSKNRFTPPSNKN